MWFLFFIFNNSMVCSCVENDFNPGVVADFDTSIFLLVFQYKHRLVGKGR